MSTKSNGLLLESIDTADELASVMHALCLEYMQASSMVEFLTKKIAVLELCR